MAVTESEVTLEALAAATRHFTRDTVFLGTVRSVLDMLRQAEKVKGESLEMFALITAEEEAATCFYLALKLQGYSGADHLNIHRHPDKVKMLLLSKAATKYFSPFDSARSIHLARQDFPATGKAKYWIRLYMNILLGNEIDGGQSKQYATLMLKNPLTTVLADFSKPNSGYEAAKQHVIAVLDQMGISGDRIAKQIQKFANLRNRCLYSDPKRKLRIRDDAMRSTYAESCLTLVVNAFLVLQAAERSTSLQLLIDAWDALVNEHTQKPRKRLKRQAPNRRDRSRTSGRSWWPFLRNSKFHRH